MLIHCGSVMLHRKLFRENAPKDVYYVSQEARNAPAHTLFYTKNKEEAFMVTY